MELLLHWNYFPLHHLHLIYFMLLNARVCLPFFALFDLHIWGSFHFLFSFSKLTGSFIWDTNSKTVLWLSYGWTTYCYNQNGSYFYQTNHLLLAVLWIAICVIYYYYWFRYAILVGCYFCRFLLLGWFGVSHWCIVSSIT